MQYAAEFISHEGGGSAMQEEFQKHFPQAGAPCLLSFSTTVSGCSRCGRQPCKPSSRALWLVSCEVL